MAGHGAGAVAGGVSEDRDGCGRAGIYCLLPHDTILITLRVNRRAGWRVILA